MALIRSGVAIDKIEVSGVAKPRDGLSMDDAERLLEEAGNIIIERRDEEREFLVLHFVEEF